MFDKKFGPAKGLPILKVQLLLLKSEKRREISNFINGTKYSRMGQVKFVEDRQPLKNLGQAISLQIF